MADSLAGVVLAAGAGHPAAAADAAPAQGAVPGRPTCRWSTSPSTGSRRVTEPIAVNVHHGRDAAGGAPRTGGSTSRSRSPRRWAPPARSGALREWIDGRPVLVVNGDTWCRARRPRRASSTAGTASGCGCWSSGGGPLRPAQPGRRGRCCRGREVERLAGRAVGPLRGGRGAPTRRAGRLEVGRLRRAVRRLRHAGDVPRRQPSASGGESVVGAGAVVDGRIERCVVWPGAVVRAGRATWSTRSAPTSA